jgi:pyridinium-3,5-biscarboxylic acid mononucleotide sulfurtransferase
VTSEVAPALRPASLVTHLARIEVGPVELPKFLADGVADEIAGTLKEIGYAHVTLDLQGYRRGSTNEVLGKK